MQKSQTGVSSLPGFYVSSMSTLTGRSLFTGSFRYDRYFILVLCTLHAWKHSHLMISRGYFYLQTPWWANQFHRTCRMRKWLQTCLIQRVKVSYHRDWGNKKHDLSSCMTTPSVWHCAGAQPAVISLLTKLLIVWMLPSCSDTLFSCSRICLFH